MLPLSGVTVVSIEQAVAAPFATRQLADLGARVIKIERPDGGDFARSYDATVKGQSSYFVWLNRSKESLTLDLKHDAAAAVLDRLLARADVFVQNLAPGAAARLGADAASLRARFPRLIVCEISGYGTTGPYAARKAYDLLVQGEVGLISLTGTEESPARVGISVADIAAGMYAFSGILTALLARAKTGEGTTVAVSLFDALGEWMSAPAYYTAYGGSAPRRAGSAHATIAPYERFATREGGDVFIAVQNAREWTRLCVEVLEQPALADDPRFRTNSARVEHRAALHETIGAVVGRLSAAQLCARLEAVGIAYARANAIEDFVTHPQLEARDRWRTIASPGGPLRVLQPPIDLDGVEPVLGPVPALGEHSKTLLVELGFDDATIAAWRREGMI
jgi:crotonobetainyl-CoA:carnitine CoA-transferase CaiB-like acyl-CoA transferase